MKTYWCRPTLFCSVLPFSMYMFSKTSVHINMAWKSSSNSFIKKTPYSQNMHSQNHARSYEFSMVSDQKWKPTSKCWQLACTTIILCICIASGRPFFLLYSTSVDMSAYGNCNRLKKGSARPLLWTGLDIKLTLSRNACYILKKNIKLGILCTLTESQNALKMLGAFDVTTNSRSNVLTAEEANKSAFRIFILQGP